jgi:hypothetical protein
MSILHSSIQPSSRKLDAGDLTPKDLLRTIGHIAKQHNVREPTLYWLLFDNVRIDFNLIFAARKVERKGVIGCEEGSRKAPAKRVEVKEDLNEFSIEPWIGGRRSQENIDT